MEIITSGENYSKFRPIYDYGSHDAFGNSTVCELDLANAVASFACLNFGMNRWLVLRNAKQYKIAVVDEFYLGTYEDEFCYGKTEEENHAELIKLQEENLSKLLAAHPDWDALIYDDLGFAVSAVVMFPIGCYADEIEEVCEHYTKFWNEKRNERIETEGVNATGNACWYLTLKDAAKKIAESFYNGTAKRFSFADAIEESATTDVKNFDGSGWCCAFNIDLGAFDGRGVAVGISSYGGGGMESAYAEKPDDSKLIYCLVNIMHDELCTHGCAVYANDMIYLEKEE